jgi:hypothetical protein
MEKSRRRGFLGRHDVLIRCGFVHNSELYDLIANILIYFHIGKYIQLNAKMFFHPKMDLDEKVKSVNQIGLNDFAGTALINHIM